MKTTYFTNCKTIEELKKEYKRLATINHPDNGGNEEAMKNINNEYDLLFNLLKSQHNSKAENKNNQFNEQPEEFRKIIETLITLDGLIIEICGTWIWLSGDTFKHKVAIKELNFKWASNKKMWYFGELQGKTKKTLTMEEIREKYGSEIIKTQSAYRIN